MSDRNVLAVLIRAGDTTLEQPLGVGGLVNRNIALVVLGENVELTSLTVLEVLITPVPLGDDEQVERIRAARIQAVRLNGTGETMAAIRLSFPSRYGDRCSVDPTGMVRELESLGDIWRTGQKLSGLGDRMTDAEVAEALRAAGAAEARYSAQNLRLYGERSAQEIGANCDMGCRECD